MPPKTDANSVSGYKPSAQVPEYKIKTIEKVTTLGILRDVNSEDPEELNLAKNWINTLTNVSIDINSLIQLTHKQKFADDYILVFVKKESYVTIEVSKIETIKKIVRIN